MRVQVRKIGNSLGVILPSKLLRDRGIGVGDVVHVSVDAGRIVLALAPPADELTAQQIAAAERFMIKYHGAFVALADK